jgi:outer membrane protein OmpA-like peptidoglycan-associated protein/Zn ribbon nucleic-acid-binding protein
MDTFSMEVCPACKKKAAPQFMWHSEDGTTSKCLECFHKEKNAQPAKRREVETTLKSESKTAGYAMKAAGIFLSGIILVVAALCLFYKPAPMKAPVAKAEEAARDAAKLAKRAAKAATDKAKELASSDDNKDGEKKDDKKDDAAPAADADAAKKTANAASNKILTAMGGKNKDGSEKERVAPTVQALTADMPKVQGQHIAQAPSSNVISQFVDKANEAANALQSGPATAPGQLNPNAQTKAKVEQTKAVVMATASALIEKADADGTKSAAALAKLGSVSSAFAEVASQLAPPTPVEATKGGGGGVGGISGSAPTGGRLETDVLETQGKAGYDPMEAVRRELENDPAAKSHMIRVEGDPKARALAAAQNAAGGSMGEAVTKPGMRPGSRLGGQANGEVGEGIVQNTAALSVASLPAAFAAAARAQNVGLVSGGGAATGQAAPAAQMSVTVLSMRGDLLFDFNSAALRADANANLTQLAKILATQPNLPLLVRGYTDSKGALLANNSLSRKRAEIVRDWLVNKAGIKKENIIVQGLGPTEPVAPNENSDGSDNPGGREKNRRVTVTVPQRQQAAL